MNAQPPAEAVEWARSSVNQAARVVRVESMPDASHANHRLVIETAAGTELDLVLRRYTDAERLGEDPWYAPRDEVEALRTLEPLALPVPRLIAADVGPAVCDVPALLVTWMPGSAPEVPEDPEVFVMRLAEPLPAIHGADRRTGSRAYEPYFVSDGRSVADLRPPAWSGDSAMWERAFEAIAADPSDGPVRFIHRDYHHGNTVWEHDELTGIIDWTAGCVGPPGIDLARMRLNLLDFDLETADRFLDTWRAVSGADIPYHPYWDLLDAADMLYDDPPADAEEAIRDARYEEFVRRALSSLA